jgi:MHS family proline/betaine transporter-like MFS transporter
MLIAGFASFLVLAWPLFFALNATTSVVVAGLIFIIYHSLTFVYNVPNVVVAAELFPRRVRYTGTAISINMATILAGGTSPYVAQWLVDSTHDPKSPAWWIIGVAAIALVAALSLRETSHDALPA